MRRRFIINPHSGNGISARAVARLRKFFVRKTGAFDCRVTSASGAAVRATRESLREGVGQVIAVGGDGTINAVVNGFFEHGKPIRPDSSLAVADIGTASDYFKAVAAGKRCCLWKELVLEHTVRSVDIGRIHYADPGLGDRYFVNMASVGMTAEVAARRNRGSRWLPPKLRYVVPAVGSFFSYRPRHVELAVDDSRFDLEIMAISLAKGIYAGDGMRFGGDVTLFDGLFDVTFFRSMKPVEMLLKLRKMYTGSFKNDRRVKKLRGKRIAIRSASPIAVEFDGEVYGTTDIEVSLEPKVLRVCFPKE